MPTTTRWVDFLGHGIQWPPPSPVLQRETPNSRHNLHDYCSRHCLPVCRLPSQRIIGTVDDTDFPQQSPPQDPVVSDIVQDWTKRSSIDLCGTLHTTSFFTFTSLPGNTTHLWKR
ncbi:unnamed protein product [Euphydryas editha]|uniref:Uncharacterized protein n=1 Tax=Euphydryas editha TaxID=104508 RepID=A0AAU9TAF2_EUPED|nr:unnamed protein product [Euphydryas editha]